MYLHSTVYCTLLVLQQLKKKMIYHLRNSKITLNTVLEPNNSIWRSVRKKTSILASLTGTKNIGILFEIVGNTDEELLDCSKNICLINCFKRAGKFNLCQFLVVFLTNFRKNIITLLPHFQGFHYVFITFEEIMSRIKNGRHKNVLSKLSLSICSDFNYVKTCPEPHLHFLCDEHATYNSTYTVRFSRSWSALFQEMLDCHFFSF